MYGKEWRTRGPFRLTYAAEYPTKYEDLGLEKLVFLSRVIPAVTNVGYENLSHLIVTSVNNREIKSMKDLAAALETPVDGFHKIEFSEFPGLIYLDAGEAEETNQLLQRSYGIHELKQLD